MGRADTDRNLLFGVLALQMDFIGRDALVAAMNAWVLAKHRGLGEILQEQGALSAADRALLEPLVEAHVQRHGGDPTRSLAAVGSATTARRALEAVAPDQDVQASLGFILEAREPEPGEQATVTFRPTDRVPGMRFRVVRPHAKGGLGVVSVAIDEELGRQVAFKEIKEEYADHAESRSRFVLEAEVTGKLEHPGIVPVYGLGRYDDGRPYYAMRFVRGDSLQEAIKRFHAADKPTELELRDLLGRFLDVCEAMAYAHSRGVLHRDLKPDNVMLGPYGETLVVDWGLAKAMGGDGDAGASIGPVVPTAAGTHYEGTVAGAVLGTPAYMSPEQAAGEIDRLGPASDVYGLGAILYSLLTGKPPVEGGETAEILARVRRGEIPAPREVKPWVPKPLEAVCRKAMALKPGDRYATPKELAADLKRWLADEPVSAWREPWGVRARRWVGKHRTLVTTAAAVAVVAGLGLAAYVAQRVATAYGRVAALESAEIRAVPGILADLGGDRALVRGRLTAMAADGQPDGVRLRGALALLPVEQGRAEYLIERMLKPETTPEELLVIRGALGPRRLIARRSELDAALKGHGPALSDGQLRALGALALAEPGGATWKDLAGPLARKLADENPLRVGAWREAFQPVAGALTGPLREIYADRARPEARALAFTMLLEFADRADNPTRPEDLAALMVESEPERLNLLLTRLGNPADRSRAVAALVPLLTPLARFDDAKAERQGRVAVALARLGEVGRVWPLLKHTDDPSVRTEVIHELARYGVDPKLVAARLRTEPDGSARRALLLALGEFPVEILPATDRQALAIELLGWYRTAPDPGVHGGLDWLLRRHWDQGAALDAIDKELASPDLPTDRDWYVNAEGQTYTIIRGPVEFTMGSTPESDPQRQPDEVAHRRRIPRSFAIAAREVTVAEYARFLEANADVVVRWDQGRMQETDVGDWRGNPQFVQQIPTADCAIGVVTYYEAARYCNWLSARDGLPEVQWCYPKEVGPGMTLPDDHVERTGYRLPTEGEWEYACRAGAVSARPFGRSEARLPAYGWFLDNSGQTMHPVGTRKPNDLGLFDTLGNAFEWCGNDYRAYAVPEGVKPLDDALVDAGHSDNSYRLIRGGALTYFGPQLRAANRDAEWPSVRLTSIGFRPARTSH